MIKRERTRREDKVGEPATVVITFEEEDIGSPGRVGIPGDILMEALREIPKEDLPTAKVEILSYVRSKRNGNVRRIRITTQE